MPLPTPQNTADGAAVPSPCVSICKMRLSPRVTDLQRPQERRAGAQGSLCEGCGRTLDEIAAWSVMSDESKRAVWAALPARMRLLAA